VTHDLREACSKGAETPFDNILARLTASDPSVTDYVLEVLELQAVDKFHSQSDSANMPAQFPMIGSKVAHDAGRLARCEQDARVFSLLSHSNIEAK
jgi:hypothetical protein